MEAQRNSSIPAESWYEETDNALYIYIGITGALFVASLVRTLGFFLLCMSASVNLHHRMFRAVLHSPMKFFDDNPSGENNFR